MLLKKELKAAYPAAEVKLVALDHLLSWKKAPVIRAVSNHDDDVMS